MTKPTILYTSVEGFRMKMMIVAGSVDKIKFRSDLLADCSKKATKFSS